MSGEIFLGTVNIEPNRWGLAEPGGHPLVRVSHWLDAIAGAGFDGLELWERHATSTSAAEVEHLRTGMPPVRVFNSYVSWDEPGDDLRDEAALWVERLGASGVKFNVGNDAAALADYVDRLRRFDAAVPSGTRLLCECHLGTLADDPTVAAEIFDAVAGTARLQAIVHLHPAADSAFGPMLDGLGDRIGHVHVQCQSVAPGTTVDQLAEQLEPNVARIVDGANRALTWTIEFSQGVSDFEAGYDPRHDTPSAIIANAGRDRAALREAMS